MPRSPRPSTMFLMYYLASRVGASQRINYHNTVNGEGTCCQCQNPSLQHKGAWRQSNTISSITSRMQPSCASIVQSTRVHALANEPGWCACVLVCSCACVPLCSASTSIPANWIFLRRSYSPHGSRCSLPSFRATWVGPPSSSLCHHIKLCLCARVVMCSCGHVLVVLRISVLSLTTTKQSIHCSVEMTRDETTKLLPKYVSA